MNSLQILILSILWIFAIIAVTIIGTIKREGVNIVSAFVLLVIIGCLMLVVTALAMQNNKLKEIVGKKCPEYEKIENVYKLKQ